MRSRRRCACVTIATLVVTASLHYIASRESIHESTVDDAPESHATAKRSLLYEEVSRVSPDHPSSSPANLWIEVDHKRTLLRRTVYYDGRPHLGPSLVIISLHNDRDEPVKPSLHARVVYNDSSETCTPLEYWKQIGSYKPVLKDYYVAYLLRVPLPTPRQEPASHRGRFPLYLVVSRDNSCNDAQSLPVMPIFKDVNNDKGDVFAVCTGKALYGDIDPHWIVHWIELNAALGAAYITILIQDVNEELIDAIAPYKDEGLVEVIDWRISINDIHEQGAWASMQECIYRNINRAQYLSLHDSDEILVPQKHSSWIEMIDDLNTITTLDRYASISFPNAYWFDVGLPLQSAENMMCEGMKLPEYFKRTDRSMNPEYRHPKSMLCLDSIITSDIHEISDWTGNKEQKFLIPPDRGQSFHYRSPMRMEDYAQHNRTYDPQFMLPYVQSIMHNLRQRFCKS